MALQDIINTATNIEINRSKLVAQTVSRSGRISVASRNWANPFRFTVTPKPVWTYTEYRAIFEPIFTSDRYTTQTIALTNFNTSSGALTQTGMFWLTNYQGALADSTSQILDKYTATSMTGNALIITKTVVSPPANNISIFKAGDYLRIVGGTYPYIVSSDVVTSSSATETVTVHRGKLETFSSGTNIYVGRRAAVFNVIVSKLPQIRFLPGQLVEFTSDFEMVEAIL
jgi:hypothetical protein